MNKETNNCNTNIAKYISRSKSNQTTKFGHLIEYNIKIIFLQKIVHKMWWEI